MRIVFAAGGTGGHVNPALAVAGEIKNLYPDASILFIGTADKLEATLVPRAGYDFRTIEISGFQRSLSPSGFAKNLKLAGQLMTVTAHVEKILNEFKPDVVVGFGGYVSGPVVRTAHKMGIKTAIHEQNAYPGKTNQALAKYADCVMLSIPEAQKYLKSVNKPIITGMPVRSEIFEADRDIARAQFGLDSKPMIFSTGGSLGAAPVNTVMTEVITALADEHICTFIHGCGKNGVSMKDKLAQNGIDTESRSDVNISEYIYDMAGCYAAADLVISRAGASSLAEIQAAGKASVLIPSPYVAENHQYHNAMSLVSKDAAILVEEKDLTADRITAIIRELVRSPKNFTDIGTRAKALSNERAGKEIGELIIGLIGNP